VRGALQSIWCAVTLSMACCLFAERTCVSIPPADHGRGLQSFQGPVVAQRCLGSHIACPPSARRAAPTEQASHTVRPGCCVKNSGLRRRAGARAVPLCPAFQGYEGSAPLRSWPQNWRSWARSHGKHQESILRTVEKLATKLALLGPLTRKTPRIDSR